MNSSLRRHPLDAIVDRPRTEAAVAVAAAWLAFMVGLLIGGEVEDAASFAFACASGAVLVFLGFAAASRRRTLFRRVPVHRVRLAVLSLRAALLAKYTLAGVPLGWIFWRWGLPYAILCHVAANAAHLVIQESVF